MTYCPYCNSFTDPSLCQVPRCGGFVCGNCGQCNHGKGRPAGHDANHARWHGPYTTLAEARQIAHDMPNVLIRSECKCI